MNNFLTGLQNATNYTYTENGAITHKSTGSDLYDMFAMGGAFRTRSDADCVNLFKNAYEENPEYALKCLFYLRDTRGGQGERRFFRVCMKWLAKKDKAAAERNLKYIPEYGRYDDLYLFVGTPLESAAMTFIKNQLALDMESKTPSLLAKWLKSENTSSPESRRLGALTRKYMGMTAKQYRKTLSILRKRINVLERLMSEGRWDEIEFDKIPSRAGMIYKNAFARHDVERMKQNANVQSYADFAQDDTKKVNAKVLYPYECVAKALELMRAGYYRYVWDSKIDIENFETNRAMINKYWDNLANYFNEKQFNGLAIVDTSGSMWDSKSSAPINVAISLGLYCAEKAKGPFASHFMTFSSSPSLVRTEGIDFCDKCDRMISADWGGSTNIEAAFDLLLDTALRNKCTQDELPQNLIVISDMEFNGCVTSNTHRHFNYTNSTLFETMRDKWAAYGYTMPKLIFWNVQARQNNIPMIDNENVSLVSGMSPTIFEQILSGKTGYDLMMEKLGSSRYDPIH